MSKNLINSSKKRLINNFNRQQNEPANKIPRSNDSEKFKVKLCRTKVTQLMINKNDFNVKGYGNAGQTGEG